MFVYENNQKVKDLINYNYDKNKIKLDKNVDHINFP